MGNNTAKTKELQSLIRNWNKYREMVVPALNASGTSPRQERSFLRLKAQLAAQIQQLGEALPPSMAYESHRTVEVMADLIKRHITLCTYDMSERWDLQDFENTWHQYFIYLNRLRGADHGSVDGERSIPAPDRSMPVHSRGRNVLEWGLAAAALSLLLFFLATAAGLSWNGSGLDFSAPQTLRQALANLDEAFASLWAGPSRLFEPVVATYGTYWSSALVAALALFGGLFVFARGRI